MAYVPNEAEPAGEMVNVTAHEPLNDGAHIAGTDATAYVVFAGRPVMENARFSPKGDVELTVTGTVMLVACSTAHPTVDVHGAIGVSMTMVKSNGPETVSVYTVVRAVLVIDEVPEIVIAYVPGGTLLEVEMVADLVHDVCASPSVHVPGVKLTEIVPVEGRGENAEGLEAEVKLEIVTLSVPAG